MTDSPLTIRRMTAIKALGIGLCYAAAMSLAASAIGYVVLFGRHGISIDTAEVGLGGVGLSWVLFSLAISVRQKLAAERRAKWLEVNACVSGAVVLLSSLAFCGHALWVIDGVRHVDTWDPAEDFLKQFVHERQASGLPIHVLYASIKGRDVPSYLDRELKRIGNGLIVKPISSLPEGVKGSGFAGKDSEMVEVGVVSYPAWHVVQVGYTYARCWGASDYFYFRDRWYPMGPSGRQGCY